VSTKTILLANTSGVRPSVARSLRAGGYRLIVAGGGKEALQKALEFEGPIHLLLAPVDMPGMTGTELAQRLARDRPEIEILLIANLQTGMLVLNQGWQFLPAPFESEMLRARIRDILQEAQAAGTEQPHENSSLGRQESLTKREIQILKLIANGNSTKEVAALLGIAFKTSDGHRSSLMKKLGIHDSVALVRYAIRAGLIDP